jgi:predicted phage baseplate assembly protein
MGRALDPNSRVFVSRRTGNGARGNVGADTLTLPVLTARISGLVLKPRNPLPARGGTAPEATAEARLFAPYAYAREIERAITPADYAEIAARHPKVQRAAAELRFNGSWYEMRVAIDPLGSAVADDALLSELYTDLSRFRRIGHDLSVRPAQLVALDIGMTVCVGPTYLRAHVEAALKARFSATCLADGSLGYFHPDRLSFGDDIAASRLLAAAQAVDGVESVSLNRFERLHEGPNNELANGVLPMDALEIARADSDPTAPENGRIRFEMRGGR